MLAKTRQYTAATRPGEYASTDWRGRSGAVAWGTYRTSRESPKNLREPPVAQTTHNIRYHKN